MTLLLRLFIGEIFVHARCKSKQNAIVRSNALKSYHINGDTALHKRVPFRTKTTRCKTNPESLITYQSYTNSKTDLLSSMAFGSSHLHVSHNKQFHSGTPNYNPLKIPILLLVRPFISLFGGILTRLWIRLDPHRKSKIKVVVKKIKFLLPLLLIIPIFGVYLYYTPNVEEVDVLGIKRKRFMILRTSQLEALSSMGKQYILYENQCDTIPEDDFRYRRANKVLERILSANQDVKEVKDCKMTLYIIDTDEVNTAGLPDNSVLIFKGMLDLCSNDDQLATAISQRIARSVLSHYAEDFSRFNLITILLAIPLAFYSFFDFGFLAACVISAIVKTLTVKPYDREMVMEADILGLKMAAKACFDIKEATVFWEKMNVHLNNQKTNIKRKMFEGIHYELSRIVDYDYIKVETELFDTHPSHENRAINVTKNVAHLLGSPLTRHCSLSWELDYIAQFKGLKEYINVIEPTQS